jgi:radical SAM superfamily enzyme YgiQ (UPF0313 family)
MGRLRRVALLCVDPWKWGNGSDGPPFNYGVRRIQAAILGHPQLADLEVRLIETHSLDVEEASQEIEAFDPDFIGASAFVWSFPTLLEVVRQASLRRPDRIIVFGGPSARAEMLRLPQYQYGADVIDALVEGDGESTIQDLLLEPKLSRESLPRIAGLHLRGKDGWYFTGKRTLPSPDEHPSPYQMGLVPPGRQAEVESYRGCPLSCSYCEWGDTGVAARLFGYEYLVRELTAIKALGASSSWLVDPALNLNHRAFKNLRRAEAEVGALRAIGGFRCEIYPNHVTDEHLTFLQDARTAHVGIGIQSLEKDVLDAMERPFNEKTFERAVRDVASIVPDTAVELIVGLPGDSLDGFKRTVERVSRLPVAVRVFHCLVLPSGLMSRAPPDSAIRFDPFTLRMISCKGWSEKDLEEVHRWLDLNGSHDGNVGKVRRAELNVAGARTKVRTTPASKELREALARGIRTASPWTLEDATLLEDEDAKPWLLARLQSPEGGVDLRVGPPQKGKMHFMDMDGIAYACPNRGPEIDPQTAGVLTAIIKAIHPVTHAVIRGLDALGPLVDAHVVKLGHVDGAASRATTTPRVVAEVATTRRHVERPLAEGH